MKTKLPIAQKLIVAYLVGISMTLGGLQIANSIPLPDAQHKEHPNPGKDAKGGAPYAQKKENPVVIFIKGLFSHPQ